MLICQKNETLRLLQKNLGEDYNHSENYRLRS